MTNRPTGGLRVVNHHVASPIGLRQRAPSADLARCSLPMSSNSNSVSGLPVGFLRECEHRHMTGARRCSEVSPAPDVGREMPDFGNLARVNMTGSLGVAQPPAEACWG